MNSPEERIAALEQGLLSMGEAISRVEQAVERMDTTVIALTDKLDARYPSTESVDIRIVELQKALKELRREAEGYSHEISRLRARQYKRMGASAVVAFLLGLVAEVFRSWKG